MLFFTQARCGCKVRPSWIGGAHRCAWAPKSGRARCVRAIQKTVATHPLAKHCYSLKFSLLCTVTVQYWCSVSKAKHDWVFSAALLNGCKNSKFLILLYYEVIPWNGTPGDLPLWIIETSFSISYFSRITRYVIWYLWKECYKF